MALSCYILRDRGTVVIRLVRLSRTKTPRYQRILGPGEEGVVEVEWKTLSNELDMKNAGHMLDEQLIYVPQVPYPELLRVKKSLLAPKTQGIFTERLPRSRSDERKAERHRLLDCELEDLDENEAFVIISDSSPVQAT